MEQRLFKQRRDRIFSQIQAQSLVILPAASLVARNSDVTYPLRQESYFYYTTGFVEADAIAVFYKNEGKEEYILFSHAKDPEKERWEGAFIGQAQACKQYGADIAYPLVKFFSQLEIWVKECHHLYLPLLRNPQFTYKIMKFLAKIATNSPKNPPKVNTFHNIDPLIAEMRVVKGPEEVACMRKAAEISAQAHVLAMQNARDGVEEYVLAAQMQQYWRSQGCLADAYPPIVGRGRNACTLHYTANRDRLQDGDLVLIDAGGEYENYAADITRTFPVNGQFSAPQKALYAVVLAAQKAGIEAARVNQPWDAMDQAIVKVMTEGLKELGLLKGDTKELIASRACRQFYWHGSGHYLGLDVHDAGEYKIEGQWRPLKSGMVLTVEPGVYIPVHTEGVDEKWWNIGIRIEDDILVTEQGPEVLSRGAPKEIADIEACMR